MQNVAACWHHNASSDKQPYCLPSNSNAGRHQIAPWEPQTKRNPNQQLPLAPPMPTFHSGNTFPSGGASTAALERGEQGERNTRGIRSQQETRSGSGRRSGAERSLPPIADLRTGREAADESHRWRRSCNWREREGGAGGRSGEGAGKRAVGGNPFFGSGSPENQVIILPAWLDTEGRTV